MLETWTIGEGRKVAIVLDLFRCTYLSKNRPGYFFSEIPEIRVVIFAILDKPRREEVNLILMFDKRYPPAGILPPSLLAHRVSS